MLHAQLPKKFKLEVPFYRQTLPTSCGTACLLMVGNFLEPKKFSLTPQKELEVHKEVRFWEGDEFGDLENNAKLLWFARKNRMKPRYFLEVPDNFYPIPAGLDRRIWEKYVKSFLEILNKERGEGLDIIDGCNIDNLLTEVIQGKPVICEVKFRDFVTHDVVIRGFKNNIVYIVDPFKGYQRMLRQDLAKALDLGYMKNAFSLASSNKV